MSIDMNQSFKYEFNEVKFYEYTIRMTMIDNTEMYLVSDLLKQYNKINNKDKRINDYFRRKDTQELLHFCRDNSCEEISAHENFEDDFVNIPNVIMKIDKFYNNNTNIKAYIVNAAILHDILMWCDKIFAYKIFNFLENLRNVNNDRFVKIINSNEDPSEHADEEKENQIELLQDQLDDLKSHYNNILVRYTPEEYNYFFTVAHNELTNVISTVITKEQYEPFDKNIKRLYNLKCCNPLVLEEKLISLLSDDIRFKQVSNKEFIIVNPETTTAKSLFWIFKNKCKKIRKELNWQTGL